MYVFNPFTGTLDDAGQSLTSLDARYLKLDQTSYQTISNGIPRLEEGRTIDQNEQLVDKRYVDEAVTSLGARYYMTDTDDATGYKLCSLDEPTGSEKTLTASNLVDDQYIAGWISPTGSTFPKLIAGIYNWYIILEKTAGTKTLRVYWKMYERKTDNSEVLIATSADSNTITSKASYTVPLILDTDYEPSTGSRIVGKVYAVVEGGGSAPSIALYYEGTSTSHWEIPTNLEILTNVYVPYTGAVSNVDLGSKTLTTTGLATLGSIKSGILYPSSDSTTAVQIRKADGTTSVINVDTTNGRVGIGTTSPSSKLHIVGSSDTQQLIVKANSTQTSNLVEWQNNSGTVIGSVGGTGNLLVKPSTNSTTAFQVQKSDGTVTFYIDTTYGGVAVGPANNTFASSRTFVVGQSNTVSAANTMVVGQGNNVTSVSSSAMVFGDSNVIQGDVGVAIGLSNNIVGDLSTTIGLYNTCSSAYSMLIGRYNQTSSGKEHDILIGNYITSAINNQIIIGYGFDSSNKLTSSYSDTIAFGSKSTIPTMTIRAGSGAGTLGKIGVGTQTPLELFHVEGNALIEDPSTLGSGVLAEYQFTTSTKWSVTGDVTITSGRVQYYYEYGVGSGVGTLTQNSSDFLTPVEPNTLYVLTYRVVTASSTVTAKIPNTFASTETTIDITSTGTGKKLYFKTSSSPGNFIVNFTGQEEDFARLDDFLLQEVQGGELYVAGNINGDNASFKGNVGVGTTSPTAKLHITGSSDTQQLIVKAYSTQTANLTEWQNSTGTAQLAIASNGRDLILDTTTGTKIGTSTSQKLGFWNATPIVQPTTSVSGATFTENSGTTVNDASTFDGYTIGQVVKALRNIGLLA